MLRDTEAICLLGHHEPDYPRNRSVREALEEAGFHVLVRHSRSPFPWRHFILAGKLMRLNREVRWVFVTEGGHRLVPLVKLAALLTGRKVAFDPFVSRYNTRIEDRRLHGRHSLEALICLWQDWSSTHAADLLVFDTEEHRIYFNSKYGLDKPSIILPPGVDETVFSPALPGSTNSPYPLPGFQVLFYGTYIPLQGVEWVVEAAALLKDEDIRFTLIGRGQTYDQVRKQADRLGLEKVRFVEPVPPEGLAPYLAHADLCLGIFGDTVKAANVVPNKVVQAAAFGKAMVTRDSSAIRRYFRDGEGGSAALVVAASGSALARAILELRADPGKREDLGQAARKIFLEHFSKAALARTLLSALSA